MTNDWARDPDHAHSHQRAGQYGFVLTRVPDQPLDPLSMSNKSISNPIFSTTHVVLSIRWAVGWEVRGRSEGWAGVRRGLSVPCILGCGPAQVVKMKTFP